MRHFLFLNLYRVVCCIFHILLRSPKFETISTHEIETIGFHGPIFNKAGFDGNNHFHRISETNLRKSV